MRRLAEVIRKYLIKIFTLINQCRGKGISVTKFRKHKNFLKIFTNQVYLFLLHTNMSIQFRHEFKAEVLIFLNKRIMLYRPAIIYCKFWTYTP
jgi:hypothetical protein